MKNVLRNEYFVIILLFVASLFSGLIVAHSLVYNADATMSIFQFKLPLQSNDLLIADWHTNIIKIPLLVLQAMLPSNLRIFELFSALYIFSTSLGWTIVASIVLGRKYFVPLGVLLAVLTVGSTTLPTEIAFATIRNIEYPLFFLSLYLFWKGFEYFDSNAKKDSKKSKQYSLLYILTIGILGASDPFFIYIGTPAIIFQLTYYVLRNVYRPSRVLAGYVVCILGYLLSKVIITLLITLGAFNYYGEDLTPLIYNMHNLPTHAWDTLLAVVSLYGGDISNINITPWSASRFFMLCLLIPILAAYVVRVRKLLDIIDTQKTYASLLISSIVALGCYLLLAGFDGQIRYLVIVVLVMLLPAIEYSITKGYINNRLFVKHCTLVAITIIVITSSLGIVNLKNYKDKGYHIDKTNISNLSAIAESVEAKNINTIIAGHSYSSSVAYWSKDNLHYIPILFCNQNLPFLTRESWYTPDWSVSQNVAMIVDRAGRDVNSWQCNDKQLYAYYGQPISTYVLPALDGKNVTVLIYPKNIISKIKFIDTKGIPTPSLR